MPPEPKKDQPYFRVDEVFGEIGTAMPILPGNPLDAEGTRQQFDRPEDIVILTDPLGGQVLVRKEELPYIKRREQVASRVLAKYGLTLETVGELPWGKITALRVEIAEEMKKVD